VERSERTTAAILKFAKPITGLWPDEELFTVARQVEETMASPGWEHVMGLVAYQRGLAEARLIHQAPKESEPALRQLLGQISAYDELFQAGHSIVEGAERRRRKFEQQAAESAAGGEQ
jgi:hypothetical protein